MGLLFYNAVWIIRYYGETNGYKAQKTIEYGLEQINLYIWKTI